MEIAESEGSNVNEKSRLMRFNFLQKFINLYFLQKVCLLCFFMFSCVSLYIYLYVGISS